MITIWKHKIELNGVVEMPKGARILAVQPQDGVAYLWTLVDSEMPTEKRAFVSLGTGQDASAAADGTYVGTYQLPDRGSVFHVFELPKLMA
jgi:hypothetical protein